MTRTELRRLFARERARFARRFPWLRAATLAIADRRCTDAKHCAARDLAYADVGTGRVTLLARALALPAANLRGLVRHELAHLCDLTPHAHGAEQRADDIAAAVTGRRIRYDGHDVQTTGRGAWPRPRRLHR